MPIVFSAPRKLAGLCPRISSEKKKEPGGCGKKHTLGSGGGGHVRSTVGAVYEIQLPCGNSYVGKLDVFMNMQGAMSFEL